MSDPKDFVAGIDSDQRRSPTRVVFVTRRTSAQVKVTQEDQVQTFPEVLFRGCTRHRVACDPAGPLLAILQRSARGHRRSNAHAEPRKAPWYFLGLQELLHYFPPVVAGVLVPTLLIICSGRHSVFQHQH